MSRFKIDPDIRVAHTLPGHVYGCERSHRTLLDVAFGSAWHLGPDLTDLESDALVPWLVGPGVLDEPVIVRAVVDGGLHAMSNVCTHRGAVLRDQPGNPKVLICPYHGRRFDLQGSALSSPGFERCGFPREDEHLQRFRAAPFGPFSLIQLEAAAEDWAHRIAPVAALIEPLISVPMTAEPADDHAYDMDCNWMLYVDNYLEGLHVPFVHPALARALTLKDYTVETFPGGVLQIGMAQPGDHVFTLPADHPHAGRSIAAYYLWLFPHMMINIYPWGISLNVVRPLGLSRTRIFYRTWVADPSNRGEGAGGDVHQTESEDQAIVHRVARGIRSRGYQRGRYAPVAERGVHHFHRMVAEILHR